MWILRVVIICSGFQYAVFGSENKLRTEISQEEQEDLYRMYRDESWETIKEHLQKNKISVNAPYLGIKPLTDAICSYQIDLANNQLDEEEIDVNYTDEKGWSFLHHAMCAYREGDITLNRHRVLVQKLIKKGCPINALGKYKKTALGVFYTNGWKGPSLLLIENGAQLMVKEKEVSWNILGDHLGYLKDTYYGACELKIKKIRYLDNTLTGKEKIIKDVLYNKCKHDYKSYRTWKECFTLSLVFKRLRQEKKIIMPKVLIKYMSALIAPDGVFCTSSPIAHIEDTLEDAWNKQLPYTPILLEKHTFNETLTRYNDLIKHTTPGVWENAWKAYQDGERSKFNLIVQAFNYEGDK